MTSGNDFGEHNMMPMTANVAERALVELSEVSFVRSGNALLDRANLALRPGGRTIIVGPNGSGKSLLMRIAHGLVKPSHGRVDVGRPDGCRLRQAMVFQRPVLLRRSALANVIHALALAKVRRRERRDQAERALAAFGLSGVAHRPARILSGGEQQRLALARAWALNPEVLFLDEPSSALDPAATKAVEDAVNAFHAQGTKIVMITHDLGQARRLADDVVFMCCGRIVEHAPASRFFSSPATTAAARFVRGELILETDVSAPHTPLGGSF
ncbi:ATP-binding cassette domain-containing protein [Thioalkalivibrio paradoxus]|uniref:ABC transporter ATP-binding protein n=1 Tax=Thioalkalivibrio paradoxus ARh 1 TaxID=713585 RepID=W0DJT9_9GAMM|nr:ATP-binding cassette domain-containing protein [Thioalkalivibrio paradoxus]AHE97248.1 ABC transporter ATP-binding protein [Thioalkalivibrio paradoxus ARh 1]